MSNWTIITADNLKASGHGAVIDKARSTAIGGIDPVAQEIESAVARVRRAIATGNSLDANPAKVPNSLQAVTIRLAIFALMERIRFPLSEDQKDTKRNDNSDLIRIHDAKERVEIPDDIAAGDAEIQNNPSPSIRRKRRQFTNRTMDGI